MHRRLAAALATATLFVLSAPMAGAAGAATRPARAKTDSVTIEVADVAPAVLPNDAAQHPLTVTLVVTNRSDQELSGLTIEGERGEPIDSQAQLDQAIKHL